ncbi:hypothetical protein Pcinc_010669 [Petrolisthes cinctipes]|uniref:Uncharacterized protein n=1 Tax=Petrolisthes cinctipes TaxID=88211 RepID=A0AAE1KV59_PETCI|nr:hypothetical protein Pcinc_010669 [Petrolisthes cinctipes]
MGLCMCVNNQSLSVDQEGPQSTYQQGLRQMRCLWKWVGAWFYNEEKGGSQEQIDNFFPTYSGPRGSRLRFMSSQQTVKKNYISILFLLTITTHCALLIQLIYLKLTE